MDEADKPASAEPWVRLPLSTLNGMLEQRFARLERESDQLRGELARTQAALTQMQQGIVALNEQQALSRDELKAELAKLTGAIGALTSGNVTVRTREITFGARQSAPPPPGWAEPAAAAALVETSATRRGPMPPPPRPGYKKPVYESQPAPAATPTEPRPRTGAPSEALTDPARTVRSVADRVLRFLGVEPPI